MVGWAGSSRAPGRLARSRRELPEPKARGSGSEVTQARTWQRGCPEPPTTGRSNPNHPNAGSVHQSKTTETKQNGHEQGASTTYLYSPFPAGQTSGFCSPLDLLPAGAKPRIVSNSRLLLRHCLFMDCGICVCLVPFCASLRSRRCADHGPSPGQGQTASRWDPAGRTCGSAGGRRSKPCERGRGPASRGLLGVRS
jgi:hypothetical protein